MVTRRTLLAAILASLPLASRASIALSGKISLGGAVSLDTLQASALPAWASGLAVSQWTSLANTSLYTHIHTDSEYAALLTASGVTAAGCMGYTGAAFRQASAEFLLGAYGGGAGGWPGTDIVGPSLTADTPTWVTHMGPRPYEEIWPNTWQLGQKAITVNVGASTLTCSTVNGFQNGETCIFGGGTAPAPLSNGTTYYVVNASGYQPVT